MVRESAAQTVFFVAIVGVTTLVVGMGLAEVALYAQSAEREADREAAAIAAEVTIVNDPRAGTTYDEDEVTLYVKNVGGDTLDPAAVDLLLDGEYVSGDESDAAVRDDDHWRPGRVLELTASVALDTGDHRAVVEVDRARDVIAFEHREAFWESPGGDGVDCDENETGTVSCTVDATESESLPLTMATDEPQVGEAVAYATNASAVATLEQRGGVTDADGRNETAVALEGDGTVAVTLDTGWDDDAIVLEVENATDAGGDVDRVAPTTSHRPGASGVTGALPEQRSVVGHAPIGAAPRST